MTGASRRNLLLGLSNGRLPIVVGTHALFQDSVAFKDLGLAVIDEQHRFGVEQRLLLGGKGARTDLLVMTATPIPRTLLLTQWGEMEGQPPDRKSPPGGSPSAPRCTRWRPCRTSSRGSAARWTAASRSTGSAPWSPRAWCWTWPPPRSAAPPSAPGLAAAWAWRMASRSPVPGMPVWPRSPPARRGLLVATTVIEVGVDVPGASVMVIEHAERFGLAQLHQLRGRVGRGAAQSYCLLLHEGRADRNRAAAA